MSEHADSGIGATVESGDLQITTNYGTADDITQTLALETPAPATAEAAAPAESPTAASDGRDPQTGQFTTPPTGPPKKAKTGIELRIDQAIFKQREAERRAEAAERRVQELDARRREPEPPARPVPHREPPTPTRGDPDDPEPDPDDLRAYPDGQFDRKYLKDQSRWEARQEFRTVHRYQQQAAAHQRERASLETRAGEVAQLLAADPTVLDRVDPRLADAVPMSLIPHVPPERRPQRITIANWMAEQVFRSDRPAALAVYLSDLTEVQRLATLLTQQGEAAALRDLARIEARLGPAPAAAGPRSVVSHAKPPIQPLGSSPQQADPYDVSDDLPIEEHIRRMNAKDRRDGRL